MPTSLLRRARRGLSKVLRALPVSSATLGPPRGLADSFGAWRASSAAAARASQCWTVQPARTIERRPPVSLPAGRRPAFDALLRQSHPPAQVVRIEDARLFGLNVIAPDDHVLRDLSLHKDARPADFDWLLSAVRLPPARRLPGDLVVVGESYAASYYHWMLQALGRLCYVRRQFPLEHLPHVGVSHFNEGFHRQTLAALGIPAERIVRLEQFPHLRPDALVTASWTGSFDPAVAEWLRDAFLPLLEAPTAAAPKRIYLSRARCASRHLRNENEVLDVIGRLGFQTVFCEDLPFMSQVALFHGADAVLAPHGAGLANLAFCRPGTKVIEIFNEGWQPEIFWQLSEAVGLEHHCLFAADAEPVEARVGGQHRNIRVPLPALRELLALAGLD